MWNKDLSYIASFSPIENTIKIWTLKSDVHLLELQEENKIEFYMWSEVHEN